MAGLDFTPTNIAAIVIALSFAAGLNVYATVFSLGVMARLHWVALPTGLDSLANPWIIGVSALLFAAEFVADKIPGFDLVWNALHTFVRIPVAALLAYAASSHLTPEAHLVITCAGAVIAAIAHSSKSALRVAVTPSPEPVSNIALSTAEDGLAIGVSWIALHHPILAASSVLVLCVAGIALAIASYRLLRAALRRSIARLKALGQPA
jgi:hypothetical protein